MKTPAQSASSAASHEAFSGARHMSDQMLNGAGKAIDSTRSLANETLHQAEEKVRSLRGNIDPMVDRLASQAQKLARQSLDMASEARERAQRSVGRYADATTRYVSNEPVKAVLIAAVVGAGIALLVASSRRRSGS